MRFQHYWISLGAWIDSGNTTSVNWKPTSEYWNHTIKGMNWRHWMEKNHSGPKTLFR